MSDCESKDRAGRQSLRIVITRAGGFVGRRIVQMLRISMGDLAGEIARQCGVSTDLVRYNPAPVLEAGFATQPPLSTIAAERAGFADDGELARLIKNALETLS